MGVPSSPSSRPLLALVVVLLLGSPTQAYTQFHATCDPPAESVNFVASPNIRGTFDILWSCVFTIIACTWTIQHLNVPEQRPPLPPDTPPFRAWLEDLKWGAKGFWSQLKWMIATVLAPELILGKAVGDLVVAWRQHAKMQKHADIDGVEWTLSHAFLANMGGFAGYPEDDQEPAVLEEVAVQMDGVSEAKEAAQPAAEVGSLQAATDTRTPPAELMRRRQQLRNVCALTSQRIWYLKNSGDLPRLPDITEAEINDKSKSNLFVRAVAMIQIVWVIVQAAVRRSQDLYVSPLELATAAFSTCALISYVALLRKPQNVQVRPRPVCIPSRNALDDCIRHDSMSYLRMAFFPWIEISGVDETTRLRIPNDALYNDKSIGVEHGRGNASQIYATALSVGGILFGGIHLAGWNIEFPTWVDQELWRISAVLMTTLLPFSLLPMFFDGVWHMDLYSAAYKRDKIMRSMSFVLGVVYSAARVISLVETFRSLAYLPPNAFVSTWAGDIPHIG